MEGLGTGTGQPHNNCGDEISPVSPTEQRGSTTRQSRRSPVGKEAVRAEPPARTPAKARSVSGAWSRRARPPRSALVLECPPRRLRLGAAE